MDFIPLTIHKHKKHQNWCKWNVRPNCTYRIPRYMYVHKNVVSCCCCILVCRFSEQTANYTHTVFFMYTICTAFLYQECRFYTKTIQFVVVAVFFCSFFFFFHSLFFLFSTQKAFWAQSVHMWTRVWCTV